MTIRTKLFFSFLLSSTLLILLECSLRIFQIPPPGLFEGDLATVWTLRPKMQQEVIQTSHPFLVQTDEHGFRNSTLSSYEGAWLALGCSTTFGWGVEESEAWPAQLSALIDIPIVNGGVPGWSTHQAKQKVADWNFWSPPVVLVSYIVRDAQLAPKPDYAALPTPSWQSLQLFRLLLKNTPPSTLQKVVPRVSPKEYEANLIEIQQAFPSSKVLFFAFPQQEPSREWQDVLSGFPVLALPTFSQQTFFSDDPIHLTKEGHALLAHELRSSLVDASILPPVH